MRKMLPFVLLLISFQLSAQRDKQWKVAVTNTNTAMPFQHIGNGISAPFHPGIDLGLSINLRTKKHHDWYHDFRVGYFFHRFVQHGIPVYADIGYRYKFNPRLSASAGIGAGYLHSIPATAKFKLSESGEYENNKGVGRMQAMGVLDISISYKLNRSDKKTFSLFFGYQERVQTPFVKSYVPLLPYSNLLLGISVSVPKIKKS